MSLLINGLFAQYLRLPCEICSSNSAAYFSGVELKF